MNENLRTFTEPERRIGQREIAAGQARSAIMRRRYDAPIEEVWSACTDPERVGRWFFPVTGDLRQGGSYQIAFGVSGEILRCQPPHSVLVTWAYEDMAVDEIELRLTADGDDATMVEVEHATVTREVEVDGRLLDILSNMGSGWEPVLIALELFLDGDLAPDHDLIGFRARPEIAAVADNAAHVWGEMAEADRGDRSRWIALYVLCVGTLMIVLDATVVNVALPSIQRDLGFSQSSLAWVVNAYLIAFGGLLLLSGRLGDILGRKSVFLAGLSVFTAASLACGLAQSENALIAARFVQGLGGAMTSAVILGMIVTMFPEPRDRAKAIGTYSFVASAGGAVGLLAGGVLTQTLDWHWIFFLNIPIGIATGLLALRLLERDRGIGFGDGADLPGAALITSSLMLGVYTIVEPAAHDGWGSAGALGLGAASLALLAGFVVREALARNPLVPLRIFRSRNVSGANVVAALMVAGMFGMFFMGALYMQRVLGYDALQTGVAFLPTTIVMAVVSLRYSERLIMRFGARTTLLPGLVLTAVGLGIFTQAPVGGEYVRHILPVMILLGLGGGLSFPALMTLAMSGATPSDAGLASGLVNTMLQVGGALGLAVLATLSTTRSENLIAGGTGTPEALTSGYHLAFVVGVCLVLAALVVAVTVLQQPQAQTQAEQAGGELVAACEPSGD